MSTKTKQTTPPRRRRTAKLFAPATGWAALRKIVERRRREALRRAEMYSKQSYRIAMKIENGKASALGGVLEAMDAQEAAPPNEKAHGSAGRAHGQ